jgi:hypothetical protein
VTVSSSAAVLPPGLRLRRFRPGDEPALVALAGRALAPYGGHVERSVEHWRWAILDRPGLEPEADIFVLERAGEAEAGGDEGVRGHAVLAPDGTVLELFLDPELVGAPRAAAASTLIGALEARCVERGLEAIQLEQPRIDGPMREALLAAGYRDEESSSLQVILVDVVEALHRILSHRLPRVPHGWRPRFVVELAPGFYRPHPTRSVLITIADDQVQVEENPTGATPRDVTIGTDLSCLTDMILRRTTFNHALAQGRVSVRPASGEQDARTLGDLLALKSPWYSPPADGR